MVGNSGRAEAVRWHLTEVRLKAKDAREEIPAFLSPCSLQPLLGGLHWLSPLNSREKTEQSLQFGFLRRRTKQRATESSGLEATRVVVH